MAKRPGNEPNLELPSFRLGRRKKSAPAEPMPAKQPPAPPRQVPAPPSEPEVLVRRKPAPAPPTLRKPPVPPTPPAEPILQRRPPAPPKIDTAPPKVEKKPKPAKAAKPPKAPKAAKPPKPKRQRARRRIRLPRIPGPIAALVTGGLVGGLTVALAYGTAQGCDAVRGVGTCGGFGLFALLVILGIDVVLGAGILRLCRVVDATTTALLGVGLLAVLAMLFFLRSTDSPAMVYVIPTLMAVTFVAAQWVTNAIATKIGEN